VGLEPPVLLDRVARVAGVRRDPVRLAVGDTLDFWRVEDVEPPRMLRLRAEMRLPGLAWLELSAAVTQKLLLDNGKRLLLLE